MNVIELIILPFLTNYSNSLIVGRIGFGLDISPCLHCFESNARQKIMTLKKTISWQQGSRETEWNQDKNISLLSK